MATGRPDRVMTSPLGAGIGLRAAHHDAIVADRPPVGWFEAHAENYMGGGAPRAALHRIRRDWPVALHGVGLSLGSADGIDAGHLDRLAALAGEIEPLFVSEHLAWSGLAGRYLNDLLPLPYTEETLAVVARHVDQVQTRLGRPILVENPSCYLRFGNSTIPEGEFLAALARQTGCGLLLDVNNLHVNAINIGTAPAAVIAALDPGSVAEIHVAGHHRADDGDITLLIDDHGAAVSEAVWLLYAQAVARFPAAAALVEWDANLPPLDRLVAEAREADRRRDRATGGSDVRAA